MTGDVLVAEARRSPRGWRLWDLDLELRYVPVVRALPLSAEVICEIGSGSRGLASWCDQEVVGVDPAADREARSPKNLRLVRGEGSEIPLDDGSVSAAIAVDTFEHIAPDARRDVAREMIRVTRAGGRVILNGPVGAVAAAADRRLAKQYRRVGTRGASARWLAEHLQNGPPDLEDIRAWFDDDRVERVDVQRIFNVHLWYVMHLVALGVLPSLGPLHRVVWGPVGAVTRSYHRGPCYRQLIVAHMRPAP